MPIKTAKAVSSNELEFLSNRVTFLLKLSSTRTKMDFIDLSSTVLPWLIEDIRIRDRLIEGIRIGIRNSTKKGKILSSSLQKSIGKEISEVLGAYEIRVDPELIISIEEHSPNAIKVHDNDRIIEKIEYTAIVSENTKKMSSSDLQVSMPDNCLKFNLDPEKRQSDLTISVKSDCFLSGIEIGSAEEMFCTREYSLILGKSKNNKLLLPIMPVQHYGKIAETRKVELVFILANGKRITKQVEVKVPQMSGVYASWFLDMGSTQVKDFEVEWSQSSGNSKESDEVKLVFEDLATNARVFATESSDTRKFIQDKQLPHYDKARLVSAGESSYASWITSCVYKISSDLMQKGKYLHSIHFSMPNIEGLSIAKVQKIVSEETKPYVLDSVCLVSEHDALRSRFGKVLSELAKTSKMERSRAARAKERNRQVQAKKDNLRRDYQRSKEKYDSRNWLSRIFHKNPKKPDYSIYAPESVPTLKEWHKKMEKIQASDDLSEVIIFDAGGYSFDIYARVAGKTFGKSFRAGGVHLTEMIQSSFEKQGVECTWDRAEDYKIEYCGLGNNSSDKHNIGKCTGEIYSEPLKNVVHWLNKTSGNKIGVPMILTGGGFNNPHLRELVINVLSKAGVVVEPLTSTDITNLIITNNIVQQDIYRKFVNITNRYLQSNEPNISHDICGGMLESYSPPPLRRQ